MQPGLEKVYFTLQEDRLGPPPGFKPADSLGDLVREADARQQLAEVLLTSVRPRPPARWVIDPARERAKKVEQQVRQVGFALLGHALRGGRSYLYNPVTGRWEFPLGLLDELVQAKALSPEALTLPTGERLTLEELARLESQFTPERLARGLTRLRLRWMAEMLTAEAEAHKAQWYRGGQWTFPPGISEYALRRYATEQKNFVDAWKRPIVLVRRGRGQDRKAEGKPLDGYDLVSAGPDGKFNTEDDLRWSDTLEDQTVALWWKSGDATLTAVAREPRDRAGLRLPVLEYRAPLEPRAGGGVAGLGGGIAGLVGGGAAGLGGFGGGFQGGVGGNPGMMRPAPPDPAPAVRAKPPEPATAPPVPVESEPPSPPRLRDFFPETLLWQPALITDERGVAELPVKFADSITTWRLSASASSKAGLLGGASLPIRVFQDFFVDIDLPLALTRGDEVAFPVAVYNYLKEPQKVQIDLQPEGWFELVDGAGWSRTLDLKAGEVTAVSFRVRAKRVGHFPLTVKAQGTKRTDAVRRSVEVAPDGYPVEQVFGDRLSGTATQTIVLPDGALPDASRLLVKVSPSVVSQILEGIEGILQAPHGCFEQTSAATYPNLLVLDYLKKAGTGSPEVRRRAEELIHLGYQRLLTFERPGGGFDWWGKDAPVPWLTALGLHELTDMARVSSVDPKVIDRTRTWLLGQQAADGSWADGDKGPRLVLTSYVAWAMLESGLRTSQVEKALSYIRENVRESDGAYVRALAANALASWDRKDATLATLLRQFERQKEEVPESKACRFPSAGHGLAHSTGEGLTVETTALVALAMNRSGQFTDTASRALAYLVQTKGGHGTWGSTQATVLALKALTSGSPPQQGTATFTVLVNGQEAAKGEITEANADVMQQFDLTRHLRPGRNEVALAVEGKTDSTYHVVSRHYEPWKDHPAAKARYELAVDYDRTRLSTKDLLKAKATLKHHGKESTAMVMVELSIPPGFTVDSGDFAEMVKAKNVEKFSLTPRQATLYLGAVPAGSTQSFAYTLRPKYPIKASTPAAVAWEYYTPAHRATSAPVELTVEEAGR
jgi:hypothetical protein